MRALAVPLLLLAALIAALALDTPLPKSDFVWVGPDVFTLDPQKMSYQQDLRLEMALDETLAVHDPVTSAPIPGAAIGWEVSEDGRTYTFHLRPEARWSDGTPVTAEDFRFAWMRALLPDTAADYSGFFFPIEGAREFFLWRTDALAAYARRGGGTPETADALWRETQDRFQAVSISAPDDHTLVVTLARPIPYWLDICAFAVASPVHRGSVLAATRIDPATGRIETDPSWTKPGSRQSNGSYRLAAWSYKRHLLLEPNEHYWGRESVPPGRVLMLPFEDNNTALMAYAAGGIDWISDVTVDYRADMAAEQRAYEGRHSEAIAAAMGDGLDRAAALATLPPPGEGERRDLHVLKAFGTDFFSFNCRPTMPDGGTNPFADARVRRAFALAVDKQAIVDRVTRMHEPVAGALTPPGSIPGYEPPKGLPFDPARARAELAAAGWEDRDGDGRVEDAQGRPFPAVDLLYTTGAPRYRLMALAMRDMWIGALGVPVSLRSKDTKFFKEDLRNGNFMVARGGWYGDYGDPMTYLELSRSTDGNNDRAYADAAFDALLDRAESTADPAERMRILHEAERKLFEEDLPLLPICNFVTIYMFEPGRVRGLTEHPRLEQYLSRLRRAAP